MARVAPLHCGGSISASFWSCNLSFEILHVMDVYYRPVQSLPRGGHQLGAILRALGNDLSLICYAEAIL